MRKVCCFCSDLKEAYSYTNIYPHLYKYLYYIILKLACWFQLSLITSKFCKMFYTFFYLYCKSIYIAIKKIILFYYYIFIIIQINECFIFFRKVLYDCINWSFYNNWNNTTFPLFLTIIKTEAICRIFFSISAHNIPILPFTMIKIEKYWCIFFLIIKNDMIKY